MIRHYEAITVVIAHCDRNDNDEEWAAEQQAMERLQASIQRLIEAEPDLDQIAWIE